MSEEEKKELTEEEAHHRAREVNEAQNNERLKRMEAIADSSEQRRDDIEGLDPPDDTAQAEAQAKALQEEGVTPEESDERVTDGVRYYRNIINGQERWMTLKELRETSSKVAAADEYLRQASEAVKQSSRTAPSTDEQSDLQEEEVRKLLAATALGDEEAIGKLAKAITARPSQTDVLQAFDQRMSFRTELAQLEAQSSDLLKDPYMGRLFRSRLNELKTDAPTTKLADAYTSIDKELRTAFPSFKNSTAQDKLERKRTLSQVPSAASRQGSEDEGEEDASVVIEKMAKARGLSAHLHRRQ